MVVRSFVSACLTPITRGTVERQIIDLGRHAMQTPTSPLVIFHLLADPQEVLSFPRRRLCLVGLYRQRVNMCAPLFTPGTLSVFDSGDSRSRSPCDANMHSVGSSFITLLTLTKFQLFRCLCIVVLKQQPVSKVCSFVPWCRVRSLLRNPTRLLFDSRDSRSRPPCRYKHPPRWPSFLTLLAATK